MQTEQYELNWKNYYNILELCPTANAQEIKRTYRRLAGKYHPDRAEDSMASDRMAEINEAYEVLSDTDRRAKYEERFNAIYAWQLAVEEALEAVLARVVITRRARERRKNRWTECLPVSMLTGVLECLLVSVPTSILVVLWLVYLLMGGIILLLLL